MSDPRPDAGTGDGLSEAEREALLHWLWENYSGATTLVSLCAEVDRILAARAARAESDDELRNLRRWKAEATSLFDGMQDLGRALEVPLGTLVTGPLAVEAANRLRQERDAARAESDRLRAGVEALVRDYEAIASFNEAAWKRYRNVANDLRALLADPGSEAGSDGGAS